MGYLDGSEQVRYEVHPEAAVGVPIISAGAVDAWAWAAYVELVAAGAIPNPCWLTGVFMHLPTVEAFYADFGIASGALAGEEDLAEIPFDLEEFVVVEGRTYFVSLPVPIRIDGSPRMAAHVRKSTGASAAGVTMKIQVATGLNL